MSHDTPDSDIEAYASVIHEHIEEDRQIKVATLTGVDCVSDHPFISAPCKISIVAMSICPVTAAHHKGGTRRCRFDEAASATWIRLDNIE
jgi:hypothetical protein